MRGVGRDHLADPLVVVAEVHAELDANAESFARAERAGLAEIRAKDRLAHTCGVYLLKQVSGFAALALAAFEEAAQRAHNESADRDAAITS
ncbi:hypothetical protein AAFX91_35765 [Bradyrhizobium sp. 31Argb]|uniref:hypothetical protein n=1 Tax=unclassified Bradyrhizobium TaxID=2631580 RepID=UPI00102E956A|nr:hypothetical protein [Bradyrhizobium sp. Leo170]